ncbi:MAG: DNA polymerase IV [Deltaproteobacteria bacterium]|nr:DNA polymerase IV [Deltaproteobacteria bacterium]
MFSVIHSACGLARQPPPWPRERVRKIIHVDMDAFYASVEQHDRPELRGRPVIVGGEPRSRGVVAASSYEARRFGVKSAMPSAQAWRLCPEAVFVRPRMSRYREVSREIFAVFHEVTPLVEPLSVDEAYLDVTENALGEPLAGRVALWLKARIRERTGLTASAGVAPTKLVAKIASDMRKPDGLVIITPDQVDAFVAALPVEKLWSVGPATARRLHEMGLRTAADVRRQDPETLVHAFGRHGRFIHLLASGEDPREVSPEREPKSRGAETTFAEDVTDAETLARVLSGLAARVGEGLERLGRPGRTVTLKLRYSDFTTITRSRTLVDPTSEGSALARAAIELLDSSTAAGDRPVRLIGLSVGGLSDPEGPIQLRLKLG